ncbi:putative protein TPRXL [Prunus avium]|uniref:Uncharacterized protein n=1 Tax=Prunus avium TaxID=42229 RepID=A0A6P5T3J7_PRUAV|nr:putative protein TPRXL [Prunus avium]
MAECSDQNIKNPQPEPEDEEEEYTAVVGKHLSMLRLDNSSSSSFKSPNSSPKPRRTLKRRSPSQSPPISQPNPKKEKLDLPPNPLLRRCSSERFNPTSPPPPPPPPFYSFNSRHNQLQCPNAASPASASTDKASGAAALSAYASALRRSVSNAKPSSCSPALKTISRQSSSSSGDEDDDDDDASPNSKRLKRIKDRVREMSLWFQQVMRENEDDDEEEEEEEEEVELEPPQEHHHQQNGDTTEVESVSVERMWDGLVIHFRCHCGVPYQFLLAGGNCYYKLM